MSVATCIGCGCDDHHACMEADGPCSWLAVDYAAGLGVCSSCPQDLARWKAGDRSRQMLVAKVVRTGQPDAFFLEVNALGDLPYVLKVSVGDRFEIEWVEMTSAEFEALPQFEHIRLTHEWREASAAAEIASAAGDQATAQAQRAAAGDLARRVAMLGHDVAVLSDALGE